MILVNISEQYLHSKNVWDLPFNIIYVSIYIFIK